MNKNLILLIIQLIILAIEILFIVRNCVLIKELKLLLTDDECKYIIDYDSSKKMYGTITYRIIALKDFGCIKRGDIGGRVSSYKNLSQKGNCWISVDSVVIDNAKVMGDSVVSSQSICSDNAVIKGKSIITKSMCLGKSVLIDSTVDRCTIWGNNKLIGFNTNNEEVSKRIRHIDI